MKWDADERYLHYYYCYYNHDIKISQDRNIPRRVAWIPWRSINVPKLMRMMTSERRRRKVMETRFAVRRRILRVCLPMSQSEEEVISIHWYIMSFTVDYSRAIVIILWVIKSTIKRYLKLEKYFNSTYVPPGRLDSHSLTLVIHCFLINH